MKFGDQVIFTENGIEYPATVLAARILDEHAGADNEPLVHLAFFKEVKDGAGNTANILGTSRQFELIQFRADVAHETHEYDAEAKKESLKPGNVPLPQGVYPGGRWREALPVTFTGNLVQVEGGAIEIPSDEPLIDVGTAVITTEENASMANGWTDEAKKNRKWGAKGVVVASHDSHGLCYDVRHEDGTIGSYDPSEFTVQAEEPPPTIN